MVTKIFGLAEGGRKNMGARRFHDYASYRPFIAAYDKGRWDRPFKGRLYRLL